MPWLRLSITNPSPSSVLKQSSVLHPFLYLGFSTQIKSFACSKSPITTVGGKPVLLTFFSVFSSLFFSHFSLISLIVGKSQGRNFFYRISFLLLSVLLDFHTPLGTRHTVFLEIRNIHSPLR